MVVDDVLGERVELDMKRVRAGVGGGGEEGTGTEWEIGGLSLSGCLCCQRARMGRKAGREGIGGRWAQRDGEWVLGRGQGGQGTTGRVKGKTSGGREGPMREATGNLVPVHGEDARPRYPCWPTLMPDQPIRLRPRQHDLSTEPSCPG